MKISAKEDCDGFDSIERAMMRDDGQAAASHLLAGRPIYYCCDQYPLEIVREWPDGFRELVSVSSDGKVVKVRTIERG